MLEKINFYRFSLVCFIVIYSSMMVAKEPTKIEKLQTQIKEVSSLLQKSTNVKTDLSKSLTLLESQIGSRKELMEELTIEKIKSEKI